MMNQMNTYKVVTVLAVLAILSSCGTKKTGAISTDNTYNFSSTANNTLASCNKATDTNGSFSLATVKNQINQVDPNWLKLKFNMLSSAVTSTATSIRLFKWKVVNGQAYLDQTPVVVYTYDLSTGMTNSSAQQTIAVSFVKSNVGYYVGINDAQAQVIKVVAYGADGKIVWQKDALIPQFSASPADYRTAADGSVRSLSLTNLHPLAQTQTSGWSEYQYTNYFQALCF